jgi:hypothetical protein
MLCRGPVRVVRRHGCGPQSNCKMLAASVGVATALRCGYRLAPGLLYLTRTVLSPAFMDFVNCLSNVSGVT